MLSIILLLLLKHLHVGNNVTSGFLSLKTISLYKQHIAACNTIPVHMHITLYVTFRVFIFYSFDFNYFSKKIRMRD